MGVCSGEGEPWVLALPAASKARGSRLLTGTEGKWWGILRGVPAEGRARECEESHVESAKATL